MPPTCLLACSRSRMPAALPLFFFTLELRVLTSGLVSVSMCSVSSSDESTLWRESGGGGEGRRRTGTWVALFHAASKWHLSSDDDLFLKLLCVSFFFRNGPEYKNLSFHRGRRFVERYSSLCWRHLTKLACCSTAGLKNEDCHSSKHNVRHKLTKFLPTVFHLPLIPQCIAKKKSRCFCRN